LWPIKDGTDWSFVSGIYCTILTFANPPSNKKQAPWLKQSLKASGYGKLTKHNASIIKGTTKRDSYGLKVVPSDRPMGTVVHLEKSYKFSSLLLNLLFGVQVFYIKKFHEWHVCSWELHAKLKIQAFHRLSWHINLSS
jgi:hypothetical protein